MLGAVLAALTLAGRVEVADGQLVVRNPSPLGDANLDEALAELAGLAAVHAVPAAQWMARSPAGFVTAWFERLEADGMLRSETVWLLFIARRKGYRLTDRGYFENLRAALRTAVTGTGPGTGTSDDPLRHAAQAAVYSAVRHSVHAAVSAATATSHHAGGSSPGGDSSPRTTTTDARRRTTAGEHRSAAAVLLGRCVRSPRGSGPLEDTGAQAP